MHALTLKNPSFFRPTSRPSSPAPLPPSRPDSGIGFERNRPLNKLSLSTFRRASPAPPPATTPAPMTLVQDGSYLETLSLKLSEAVSKAFSPPSGAGVANEQVNGRRPIPSGRGHALGALIASELNATRDNAHLHRAILRCLQRPLSVMLTNLSAHLLPLVSSSAFLTPPAPTFQAPNPNPTQLHALALAGFASEILETFDELKLGLDADARGDGLKGIREGLVSLVGKVVNPLVGAIKAELMPLMEALETPASLSAGFTKTPSGSKSNVIPHPSIVTLQTTMPFYARALTRYTAFASSQSILASLLISVLWKALVALSHRPNQPSSPTSSPSPAPTALKTRRVSASTTPPATPPSARFTIKLPPSRPPSRPPSPPSTLVPSSAAADARSLYDLLSLLPRPVAAHRLAKEAVDEAYDGLKALSTLLEVTQTNPLAKGTQTESECESELKAITADLPTLIALPVVMRTYVPTLGSVASAIGLTVEEYRSGCLHGFSRAEECAAAVGQRVLDVLNSISPETQSIRVAKKWLEFEVATADD